MTQNSDYQLLLTTCPDMDTAQRIAESLVEHRLVACVSLMPQMQSVYWWHGQVIQEEEVLLIMKSQQTHYAAIEAALLDAHPYEVPELVAVPITHGLPAYLQWISEVTRSH